LAGLGFGHVGFAFPLPRPVRAHEPARSRAKQDPTNRSARIVASPHSNPVEQAVRPQPELEAAPWRGYSMTDRFSAEDLPFCPA
jgi:hypothetical protein